MVIRAPAKINLCLKVGGKRDDGYHEVATIMQTIDLYDYIIIEPAPAMVFSCNVAELSDDNLVVRAAADFYSALGRPAGVSIALYKNIPHGAGLGGGSSDAAATLWGLNKLHKEPFKRDELWLMARQLGADVPFFLTRGTAWCRGIGDLVEPLPEFPLGNYLLVKPAATLSAAEVYAAFDKTEARRAEELYKNTSLPFNLYDINSILNNDLEPVATNLCPELAVIKKELHAHGAGEALMSGSGTTMVGWFAGEYETKRAASLLTARRNNNWWVKACQGINADF